MQLVFELLELGEHDLAREMLRSAALEPLKKGAPDRYLKMEHLLNRSVAHEPAEALARGQARRARQTPPRSRSARPSATTRFASRTACTSSMSAF